MVAGHPVTVDFIVKRLFCCIAMSQQVLAILALIVKLLHYCVFCSLVLFVYCLDQLHLYNFNIILLLNRLILM